jgi:hypothetical protein
MNRGSAFKWCELLAQDHVVLNDGWGLKSIQLDGKIAHSPCGVLEEFIQQGMDKIAWHGVGYVTTTGSELLASPDTLKRVKAKTDLTSVDDYLFYNRSVPFGDSYRILSRLAAQTTSPKPSKADVIKWIQENYEAL